MRWRVVALLVSVLAAAGCSHQEVIGSGANGVDGQVGDVKLRGVRIQGPDGHELRPGDDATVWLAVIAGQEPDTLAAVHTPVASRVEIRWDRSCDGTAEPVTELPLAPNMGGPQDQPRPGADEFDPYHLRIVDLNRTVLVGTTVPLVFRFARAGEITLHVPVLPDTSTRAWPSTRCSSTAATAPAATPSR